MASLMDIPGEILIVIIKKMDTKTVYNLYNTCHYLRNIIRMHGVIRVCDFSVSTLATAKSLQLEMVRHVFGYLFELNMSGIPTLTKSLLLPAIKKMKCLETLNVAYTKINIIDVIDLYKNCQTIKNLTINFQFQSPEIINLPGETLKQCQDVFKNFFNVHFVLKSWFSNLPLFILKNSSLNNLTYTVCDWKGAVYRRENIDAMVPFNHFSIFLLNWRHVKYVYQGTYNQFLPLVELDNVEFIIIEHDTTYSLNTTPMFTKFFSENFCNTTFGILDLQKTMYGNIAILIWNKQTTVFDELFFSNLKKRIKQILACELEVIKETSLSLNIDPNMYEWFNINQVPSEPKPEPRDEPDFKKIRIVPNSQVLNYDNIFRNHGNIKLSISFTNRGIVTLSPSCEYLRKLTYLSLRASVVRYSKEFFNVLFRCCDNLITLNVEASAVYPCCPSVVRSIPLSQSIKNIRLVDKRIDFNMLFSSFSQCKTLENICIIDISNDYNNLADPATMFQKCENLYSLFIQAALSSRNSAKKLQQMLNYSKRTCTNHYINLVLRNSREFQTYDPYVHVFNLGPIKPV